MDRCVSCENRRKLNDLELCHSCTVELRFVYLKQNIKLGNKFEYEWRCWWCKFGSQENPVKINIAGICECCYPEWVDIVHARYTKERKRRENAQKKKTPAKKQLCRKCNKPIAVFGDNRANGKDGREDWANRHYHLKCWKENQDEAAFRADMEAIREEQEGNHFLMSLNWAFPLRNPPPPQEDPVSEEDDEEVQFLKWKGQADELHDIQEEKRKQLEEKCKDLDDFNIEVMSEEEESDFEID